MWYLDHFSLTPFDERYMKIPFEFMEFSYIRFMNKPGYEDIRDDYLYKKAKDKKEQEESEKNKEEKKAQKDQLLECYSEEETANILKAFATVQEKGKS